MLKRFLAFTTLLLFGPAFVQAEPILSVTTEITSFSGTATATGDGLPFANGDENNEWNYVPGTATLSESATKVSSGTTSIGEPIFDFAAETLSFNVSSVWDIWLDVTFTATSGAGFRDGTVTTLSFLADAANSTPPHIELDSLHIVGFDGSTTPPREAPPSPVRVGSSAKVMVSPTVLVETLG